MSCLMSLVAGSQVIAMFVAGPVAEKAGIPNLYYGSAAMLVGIGIVLHSAQFVAARDDLVGRAPWPAADPLVGHRQRVHSSLWLRLCCLVGHFKLPKVEKTEAGKAESAKTG